ncbi:glycosyltransferase [Alteromonas sp. H39]|uniref:glycosyltransferase n=1 Tax=Alteromonas sp. H39 TaxID=3389876 RepID=UPI0039DFF966
MANILLCASTFPRHADDPMVDFIWQQARYFKSCYSDLNIHVLVPHDTNTKSYENWEGVHIHRYRYFWPAKFQTLVYPAIWPNIKENKARVLLVPFLLLGLFFAAYKLAKKEKIDLIYSHWFMPQGLVCAAVAKLRRIPHVLTSHAADIIIMRKIPLIGPLLVKKVLPSFKAVSFAGSRGRGQAMDFFDDDADKAEFAEKSAVLPMGVDFAKPVVLVHAQKEENTLHLLFVGRLAEKKGVKYLLEAVKGAHQQGLTVYLDILGDGPLEAELKKLSETLELNNVVTFHGFVQGSDKFKYIEHCDLFVVPSIVTDDGDAEGLPVSLLEAMAAGALCCATDESGAPDILDGNDTAFLVEAKSSDALLQVMQTVNNMSEEERKRMAERARELGNSFLWENVIHRHYDYLLKDYIPQVGSVK